MKENTYEGSVSTAWILIKNITHMFLNRKKHIGGIIEN